MIIETYFSINFTWFKHMNIIFLFTLSLRPKIINLGNKVYKGNLPVLVRIDAFASKV
jgi:hypothetical protein